MEKKAKKVVIAMVAVEVLKEALGADSLKTGVAVEVGEKVIVIEAVKVGEAASIGEAIEIG